jgi:hypothetical protein
MLSASLAWSAPNAPTKSGTGTPARISPPTNTTILYDQNNVTDGVATLSANFTDFPTFSSATADDFVVPGGQTWSVSQVRVSGVYFNGAGPANDANVIIYADAGGIPGAAACTMTNIVPSAGLASGSFVIDFPTACELSPGTYWVSVVADMTFGTSGEWGWSDRTVQAGNAAQWENPGGGFGVCPTWTARATCVGDGAAPDQAFTLLGEIVGPPGAWTLVANAPIDAYGGGTTSDGTYAYWAGGYSFSAAGQVTNFSRYDPVANTWTALAAVPDTANTMASAVYSPINNKVYLFGGEDAVAGTVVATTRIYDLATNTWTTGTAMPDLRSFSASAYFNGKIYIIAGYNTSSVTSAQAQVWEYDPIADTWNTTRTNIPHAVGGSAFGVINGSIIVAGGRDASNTVIALVYSYDVASDTWTQETNLPTAENVPASAVVNGQLWVVGGGEPFASGSPKSNFVGFGPVNTSGGTQIYDFVSNTWNGAGPALNHIRSFPGGTSIGSMALCVGGYDGASTTNVTETNGIPSAPCNRVLNGNFETGDLFGWPIKDPNPAPVSSNLQAHGGTYSGHVGSFPGGETPGDSSIYQEITVPATGGTLDFWYWTRTVDTITFDWQDAYVTDTAGNILATIFHQCTNNQAWVNQTFDMSPYAGTVVRVEFLSHGDNSGDPTDMFVDDVHLDVPCPDGLGITSGMTIGFQPNGYQQEATNFVRYTFLRSQPAANQFAIFDTHDPWGFTIIKDAITGNGYTYAEFPVTALPGFNFSDYRVVILNFDDTFLTDFQTSYSAAVAALQTYVLNGGVLWLQTANQGNPGQNYTTPDGATCNLADYEGDNYIIDPSHPTMTGITGPIPGNSTSHVNFTGYNAADLLITSTGTGPGGNIVTYEYRTLCVIAPPTITPSGPTTFCQGGSVTLDAGAGYATYLWSPGGQTTQTILVNTSGTYSVAVSNGTGCQVTSAPVVVTVNPNPTPTITPSGPTTFCAPPGSVTLDAGAGYASYLWAPGGETTQTIVVSTSGSYSVTVTDFNGCSGGAGPVVVTANPSPTPTITPSGPTTFCGPGSVTLDAGAGYAAYLWSPNGEVTQTIVVSASGSYGVTVTDGNGCVGTSAPTVVTVNSTPTPVISVLHCLPPNTPGNMATVVNNPGDTYAWTITNGTIDSGQGTNQISFTSGNVAQLMTLSLDETTPASCVGSTAQAMQVDFADVPASNPFYNFICTLARNSITGGCGGGNYCPGNPVLRSQMAVFLLRSEHGPSYTPPACTNPTFTDVPCSNPFSSWIYQLVAEQVTGGCTATTFCPNNSVQRNSMAVFLLVTEHGAGYVPPACTPPGQFTDVPCPGGGFTNWIYQLVAEGITGGCTATTYCPTQAVSRAQMAVFLTVTFSLP